MFPVCWIDYEHVHDGTGHIDLSVMPGVVQSETAAIVAPLNPSAMEQKTVDTVTRDAARYRFRHSNYVDKDGYEYGYCKVRWKGGAVESMLWADDAEIDAAMAASGEPMIKDGPHREESTVPQVGVCQRCGVNRFQAACPNGHMAETTGQCPMVAIAAERPA